MGNYPNNPPTQPTARGRASEKRLHAASVDEQLKVESKLQEQARHRRRKQAARCKKKANCKSKQELWKKCKRKKPASKMQEESKQQKQARYGRRRQAARARSEQARRRSKQVSTNSWQQAPRARQHMEEANDGVLVWQDAFWRPGTCILQLVCCWCQKQCLDAWQLNFEAKKRNEKVSGKRKKAAQEGCGADPSFTHWHVVSVWRLTFCSAGWQQRVRHRWIESNVAMGAWLPQARYHCGNFSDTSWIFLQGLIGHDGHALSGDGLAAHWWLDDPPPKILQVVFSRWGSKSARRSILDAFWWIVCCLLGVIYNDFVPFAKKTNYCNMMKTA